MQVCGFLGCLKQADLDYLTVAYGSVAYCLEHSKHRNWVKGVTCKLCRSSHSLAYVLQPEDWLCEACVTSKKWQELCVVFEKADFLDALECPREVLIDLVCRWNIEQDGEALNLPD